MQVFIGRAESKRRKVSFAWGTMFDNLPAALAGCKDMGDWTHAEIFWKDGDEDGEIMTREKFLTWAEKET